MRGRASLPRMTISRQPLRRIHMKSIKILAFGNSYSVDALTYLNKILASAGYDEIILGHICDGGCNINQHWSNIDDTMESFHPAYPDVVAMDGTAGCAITRNGTSASTEGATLKERYINTVAAEEWDFVTIQHGPKHIEQVDTYSYLPRLLSFIKEHLRSEKTRIIYHSIWKYNNTLSDERQRTCKHYDTIIDITRNTVLANEEFSGIIPAVTMRQNMVSSYLTDKDIARDYGHMGLTLGRYALGLLWYVCLTGGSIDDVSYKPGASDISEESKESFKEKYNHIHLDITDADMMIVREAIDNAKAKPYEVTQSRFT